MKVETPMRVVITGATGGIGRALVARFSETGARITACDLEEADWDAIDGDIERLTFDLTDHAACHAAARALSDDGGADAIVLNAGWTRAETLAGITPEAIDRELDLNFRGTAQFTAALLPALRERPAPVSIVAISSVNAARHYGNPAYAAAKGAMEAWIRAIAAEEGRHGIRANAIRPGSVRTAAWEDRLARDPAIMDRVAAFYPLGRIVEPREVSEAALFLASKAASGITGAILPVDCGLEAAFLPFLREID
ncbi:NAD(P)-dependent dehydrogenase (short-subunit alcohol dehydrogenase family) [Palleronia aestuarii]|uniref:NAD(P)-dependent dehydrogenase (Short-subunit alcohol dehydrogenase family) n=1 Tax=Palleronia aestuarii TaxID=568105 RepID=A0A2W7N119_9RHOB|nr:SDR family oxidoreductase [Palleronia aestuarii]PZX13671.1 NAD(P)-dependent dehydrogenase (short-subunit alcohol dehydrogenase family) [Palleronia aestuarii]